MLGSVLDMLPFRGRETTPSSLQRLKRALVQERQGLSDVVEDDALQHVRLPALAGHVDLGVLGLGLDHRVGGAQVEMNEARRLIDVVLEDLADRRAAGSRLEQRADEKDVLDFFRRILPYEGFLMRA